MRHSREKLFIPLDRVIPQLSQGMVWLPLSELRNLAPSTFDGICNHDTVPVHLPMVEVLQQIKPSQYPRRPHQRTIVVPDEVTGLFGVKGQRIAICTTPLTEEPKPAPPPAPHPIFVAPMASPSLPQPVALAPKLTAPPAPLMPAMPIAAPVRSHTGLPGLPPVAAVQPIRYSVPPPQPPAPIPPSVSAAAPAFGEVLRVPLSQVSLNWPDPMRAELVGMDAANAILALPVTTVEQALKSGHVQFAWRQICAWIEPSVAPAAAATADLAVDLPLKVIAPLFMARYRPTAPQRKASVDEQIPDLFGKALHPRSDTEFFRRQPAINPPAPQPTAPTVPLRMAVPPSAPVLAAAEPQFDVDAVIGPPRQRNSPKEIVGNAAKLPGAIGAMLVMSDGMLVTSAVPTTIKAELVAAFVPQMFGRMGQYARELNMGGLNCLSLTVEAGCWQIVKQSNIYFAMLCRPKQQLPLEPLAAIAAELNKQQQ